MSNEDVIFDPASRLAEIDANLGSQISDLVALICSSDPKLFLGTTYVRLYIGMASTTCETEISNDSQVVLRLLEYGHAVYACMPINPGARQLSPEEYERTHELMDHICKETAFYTAFSAKVSKDFAGGDSSEIEYWARSNWTSIRRNRYPQHDIPFFQLMLEPHELALRQAYGIGIEEILIGVGRTADAIYRVLPEILTKARPVWISCTREAQELGEPFESIAIRMLGDDTLPSDVREAFRSLWMPDYLDISKATGWPKALLDDLTWNQGEARQFFDGSAKHGWLTKTLPVRRKPFIYLDGSAFAFETTFPFEAMYRALQWGLLARLPHYKQQWNAGQNTISESAFCRVLSTQLDGAQIFAGVRYEFELGRWAECDTVVIVGDVLLVVEAKAGVYGLTSPMDDMEKHFESLQRLLLDAYEQTNRFLEYLRMREISPIFSFKDGRYEQAATIRLSDFRIVIPIGLSVENLAPFPGLLKQLPGTGPILGKHPFVALAVDDLFALSDLLPTATEFLHYLEVRQAAALHPKLSLHDEMDHLGAYIQKNRYDAIAQEHSQMDFISINGMSDIVDRYYHDRENENDQGREISRPTQVYPGEVAKILAFLEKYRPIGWSLLNAWLRNASGDMRSSLDTKLSEGIHAALIGRVPAFHFPGEDGLSFVISHQAKSVDRQEILDHGAVACLAFSKSNHFTVFIIYSTDKSPSAVSIDRCQPPLILQANYEALRDRANLLNDRSAQLVTRFDHGPPPTRSAPCPCGSGRKFKRCHGASARRGS